MENKSDLTDVINGWIDELERLDMMSSDDFSHAFDIDSVWDDLMSERDGKEIHFARTYKIDFAHGTAGHNRLMLIAKLAELLDVYEEALHRLIQHVDRGKTS